jgi:hypothetical protein
MNLRLKIGKIVIKFLLVFSNQGVVYSWIKFWREKGLVSEREWQNFQEILVEVETVDSKN